MSPSIQTDMTIIYSYEKCLYTSKLTSLSPKSKFEDFLQDYFFFYKKVVIILLKYRLSTLKMNPFFSFLIKKKTSRKVGIKFFLSDKKKRERGE